MSDDAIFGGIEAGGTKMVCSVGTGPDDVGERHVIPTTTPQETWPQVLAFFEQQPKLAAFGIGSFGPIDLHPGSPTYGSVTTTPKPGWSGFNMVRPLQDRFGLPVGFDTDVNAAALGELRWGAGTDVDSLVYITVGTGIGGGAIVNDQPVHGILHPEMGHMHVQRHPDDEYPGGCPFHGDCMEGITAGPSYKARFGARLEDASQADQAIAAKLASFYLGQLVSTITYMMAPERIVLGGGVPNLPGLMEGVRAELIRRVNGYLDVPQLQDGLDAYVVAPALGDRAGVLGSIALAQDALAVG